MDLEMVRVAMRQCALFEGLDYHVANAIIAKGTPQKFAQGQTIYAKGALTQKTFALILAGRVGILSESGQVIRGMGGGELIGEVGAVSPQQKRTLTVVAVQPSELMAWEVASLEAVAPEIVKKLKDLAWKRLSNYFEEAV